MSPYELAGMIDWITCRLDASFLPEHVRDAFRSCTGRILKIDASGELEWESCARDVIKSDSHQIVVKYGSCLEIMGSPARVVSGNNVFGSLCIRQCFNRMVLFVQKHYSVIFPIEIKDWKVTRIDITRNYDLGSLDNVMQAIESLKLCRVGRQNVSPYSSGCMWGAGSKLHNGKAYAKGPDLRRNVRYKKAFCEPSQLDLADQILRLEYSVRRQLIDRMREGGKPWYNLTANDLIDLHTNYFGKFISDLEVTQVDSVFEAIMASVGTGDDFIPTESQAQQAYDCFCRCRQFGRHKARATYKKTTWYRNMKNLRLAGIKEIDLQQNNVVPLRTRRIIIEQPIASWDDIKPLKAIGA